MELKAFEVKQNIGTFYITKINYKELLKKSQIDTLEIYHDVEKAELVSKGIQRETKSLKIRKIKEYLEYSEATFPNSIILNVNNNDFIKFSDGKLYLKNVENKKIFQVIDGQHRLKAFENLNIDEFELPVSIFVGLKEEEQSRIFMTINTEQTKIDPSTAFYQEINDEYNTPRKFVVKLIKMMYLDKDSPWYEMIKLSRDAKNLEGDFISSKAFGDPILKLIYDDNKYYRLRNDLINKRELKDEYGKNKIFWGLYKENNLELTYKILFNYFNAVKKILRNDWANKNSILNKATGYNALMYLFNDLYEKGWREKRLSIDFFLNELEPLKKYDGKITSEYFAPSGSQASRMIYKEFLKNLNL